MEAASTPAAVTAAAETGGGGGGGQQYLFPVPAKHQYGDGYGAGRGHQGQDVFAKCGVKLIANHTGKVQTVDRHSSAGNYIVLDAKGTGKDYAYMHLKDKAIPREGSRVRKGDKIGEVGKTGNASGCHLHFEKWTAPGYYEGGDAVGVGHEVPQEVGQVQLGDCACRGPQRPHPTSPLHSWAPPRAGSRRRAR